MRTDGHEEILVAFRNFANLPKNGGNAHEEWTLNKAEG